MKVKVKFEVTIRFVVQNVQTLVGVFFIPTPPIREEKKDWDFLFLKSIDKYFQFDIINWYRN